MEKEKTTVGVEEDFGEAFKRWLDTHGFKCDITQISPKKSQTITKDKFDLINKTDEIMKEHKLDDYPDTIDNHEFNTINIKDVKPTNEKISDAVSFGIDYFDSILKQMSNIHKKKNHDYGDSFNSSIKEFGLISAIVRMNDKMCRLKNLIKGKDIAVKDESIKDTLMDLANYAAMTAAFIEEQCQGLKV